MFAALSGNEDRKEILQRLVANDRLSATLIFAGPNGIGKRQFALTLAKTVNCQQRRASIIDSCDECPACYRIDHQSHPDVRTLVPEGAANFIRVDPAREIAEEVRYRPFEGKRRFFIIDDADRMNEQAANALLKTLEEPPQTSTIILITSLPDALLPTIRSRAQVLTFAPLSLAEVRMFLEINHPRPQADLDLLARISEGRIGYARSIDLSEYRRERRELLEVLDLLAAGGKRHRLVKAAEYLGKQERAVFEKKVGFLLRLLRDMLLLASGLSRAEIVNVDEGERLELLANQAGSTRILGWVKSLTEIQSNLLININRQVAMDGFLQSSESAECGVGR